jgi:hypothetical protein
MRQQKGFCDTYGIPIDLIGVCFAAILIACAVMLGIEIVKDVFGL